MLVKKQDFTFSGSSADQEDEGDMAAISFDLSLYPQNVALDEQYALLVITADQD